MITRLNLRRGRIVLLLFLMILVSGCVRHAHELRNAQDSFSKGATLEIERKIADRPETRTLADDPAIYYELALGLVNQSLAEAESELARDQLLGQALTLKALASWRLGDSATAEATARSALALEAGEGGAIALWPRDRAICIALPSLIRIDALGRRVLAFEARSDAAKSATALRGIFVDGEALDQDMAALDLGALPDGHSFRVYLAMSRCELVHVLLSAIDAGVLLAEADRRPLIATYSRLRVQALAGLGAALRSAGSSANKAEADYEALLSERDIPPER